MKASELREKTDDVLKSELIQIYQEQMKLRIQKLSNQLNRPSDIKLARKNIAKIKTILSERVKSGAAK